MSAASHPWEWDDVRATTDDAGVRLAHVVERAELRMRHGRLVCGTGYETASGVARRSLARVGAILRLRARGRYLLHAAGVVDPAGTAWLLAGDTGSGKSTLAWVLVRQGWSLLGDDGVLVEMADDHVIARAWRDPLRVSLGLGGRYPELNPLASPVSARDARRRVAIDRDVVRHAAVRVILLLERASRDAIVRVGSTVALASLVRQSPWVLIDDEDAPHHLGALAAIASKVPTYHLAHTERQLDALSQTLAGLP